MFVKLGVCACDSYTRRTWTWLVSWNKSSQKISESCQKPIQTWASYNSTARSTEIEDEWFLTIRGRVRPDKTTGSMCGRFTGERLLLKKKRSNQMVWDAIAIKWNGRLNDTLRIITFVVTFSWSCYLVHTLFGRPWCFSLRLHGQQPVCRPS